MPAYRKDHLSDQDLADIYAYWLGQALARRGEPPAVNSRSRVERNAPKIVVATGLVLTLRSRDREDFLESEAISITSRRRATAPDLTDRGAVAKETGGRLRSPPTRRTTTSRLVRPLDCCRAGSRFLYANGASSAQMPVAEPGMPFAFTKPSASPRANDARSASTSAGMRGEGHLPLHYGLLENGSGRISLGRQADPHAETSRHEDARSRRQMFGGVHGARAQPVTINIRSFTRR